MQPIVEVCREDVQVPKPAVPLSKHSSSPLISSDEDNDDDDDDDDLVLINHVVNKRKPLHKSLKLYIP